MTPNKKMYLKNPNICPYCNSSQLEAGELSFDDVINHETSCLDCGETWIDYLSVTDVDFDPPSDEDDEGD